jgi:hypothetical protein
MAITVIWTNLLLSGIGVEVGKNVTIGNDQVIADGDVIPASTSIP